MWLRYWRVQAVALHVRLGRVGWLWPLRGQRLLVVNQRLRAVKGWFLVRCKGAGEGRGQHNQVGCSAGGGGANTEQGTAGQHTAM